MRTDQFLPSESRITAERISPNEQSLVKGAGSL